MDDHTEPAQSTTAQHTTDYERSPVDVLRLAVATVSLLVLVVLLALFGETLATFEAELLRGIDAVPDWLISGLIVGVRILAVLLFVAGLIAAIISRRLRLLAVSAGAAVLAALIYGAISGLVEETTTSIVDLDGTIGPLTHDEFPTAVAVAMVAAIVTAAAPWTPRVWRRWAWALVVGAAAAHLLTAPTSLSSVAALLVGWLAGSAALVAGGSPVRRPTDDAVAAGLAAVGVPVETIARASVDARGSTPYFATEPDGGRLFVKTLGPDERSADLLFRAMRRILPYQLGDERSFSTLRRTVEHEALVALAAADLGVRTPHFRAFATVGSDGFVLAYEGIDGSSLDGVPADQFDDELLAAVWDQFSVLHRHRVAHRDLRLANVFRAADGEVWIIDFGFSELAASDLLLATDLAELLASTSLVVGPERAIAAGVASVGADELRTALPRLRPFALSGATRTGMKANPGLLDSLRDRVASVPSE